MLSAVRYGQINIEMKEDTLTSSVFDGLFSLPNNLFWKIIKESCYKNSLPDSITSIKEYDYWPHWNPKGTKDRKNYIEPDLFIRFDNFDLIIESKRWDNDQQYLKQWEREFIAYKNEYGKDKKDVYLLAIGGISKENEENITVKNHGTIKVVKCRWYNILETLINILEELRNCYSSNKQNIIRNINFIISGLEIHDFMKIQWLESIPPTYKINYEENSTIIRNWRI
jgi:hypothetical protein